MEILTMALQARLPMISVQTSDLVFFPQILREAAGTDVVPFTNKDALEKGKVYYAGPDAQVGSELWQAFRKIGATLVLINPKKTSLAVDCGVLYPSKALIRQNLEVYLTPQQVDELLPTLGGMTLKEIDEHRMMMFKQSKDCTPKASNDIRRKTSNRLKGVKQVSTIDNLYEPAPILEEWLEFNQKFFMNPPHPKLMPRGLLFDGPPGTGKSSGAKYIAAKFGIPLYHLDVGEMKGKYVGESEGAVASALAQLDQAAPCVALFDEIEKIFGQHEDHGTTTSMLSQILWWLQEHESQVFVVMATNSTKKIPPELFREGRIDRRMVFNGLPGLKEALEFVSGVFEKLAGDVKYQATGQDFQELQQILGSETYPLPQAQATGYAITLLKQRLNEKE